MIAKKVLAAAAGVAVVIGLAGAQDVQFFRIGTGGTGGTYFSIGSLIANAISNPPGSRACAKGGSCGVPGLVAVVQSSIGSVANVDAIGSGSLESGIAQSDVAYWAMTGTGVYTGKGKMDGLRAIANLYPESVHLVARKGAGIGSVRDLKGKRVSLDEPGSGTLIDARVILQAYGLSEEDFEAEYIKPTPAIELMKNNRLDAFFFVAGYPAGAVSEIVSALGAEIVPIDGPEAAAILAGHRFFAKHSIPAGTYEGIGEIETIGVGAQWVVGVGVDDALVYAITKSLWNANSRKLFDSGHMQGKAITLETALDGVEIPLHRGAERYYKESGLLKWRGPGRRILGNCVSNRREIDIDQSLLTNLDVPSPLIG